MSNMLSTILLAGTFLPAALSLELPNNVGKLPAMGWNSWNAYHCGVDETLIMQAASTIVSKGFKDAGYTYVNSDDCWQDSNGRDPHTHQLLPNSTKFPNGIDGLAAKVHSMGLKFGIYSSAGTDTCGGFPASLGYEMVDAATFARWVVDYLKYDNCYPTQEWYDDCLSCNADPTFDGVGMVNGSCTKATPETEYYTYTSTLPFCALEWPVDGVNYTQKYTPLRFNIMKNALLAQNRTILYSLCEWGVDQPWTWANSTGSSWRMSNDITPEWERILQIINLNSFLSDYTNFYGHNDADMLEIGNGDLTPAESRSHFALWAMMKSPLIIGTDLTNLSAVNIAILQNKGLIAFNQDATYGAPAAAYKWGENADWTFNSTFPAQYWAGDSTKGVMVAMMNPFNETKKMMASYSEIPGLESGSKYQVTNVWTGKSLGCKKKGVGMKVEAHDTAVLLFSNGC